MQKNFTLIGITILGIVMFVSLVFIKLNKSNSSQEFSQITSNEQFSEQDFATRSAYLFTTSTCPHCKNVHNWLNQNNNLYTHLDLALVPLDNPVTGNSNTAKLREFASVCQIDNKRIAVPFLYLNDEKLHPSGRCILGDQDINNYFADVLTGKKQPS